MRVYRLFDTAQGHDNEEDVGRAIAASDVPRSELFITTKLASSQQGRDKFMRAFDESMRKLGLDVLDLFIVHWPLPMYDQYVETWKVFEEILAIGRVRSIGVSNFTETRLQRLSDETDVVPVLNQVELYPQFPQEELRAFHASHNILTEAWGPIGQGKGLLEKPPLVDLAATKGRSSAQIVLRWRIRLRNAVIPTSADPRRILENIDIFDFELIEDDMQQMSTLVGERICPETETLSCL
jgi:diketogulonate reductase-like aldo/keto reductase